MTSMHGNDHANMLGMVQYSVKHACKGNELMHLIMHSVDQSHACMCRHVYMMKAMVFVLAIRQIQLI